MSDKFKLVRSSMRRIAMTNGLDFFHDAARDDRPLYCRIVGYPHELDKIETSVRAIAGYAGLQVRRYKSPSDSESGKAGCEGLSVKFPSL